MWCTCSQSVLLVCGQEPAVGAQDALGLVVADTPFEAQPVGQCRHGVSLPSCFGGVKGLSKFSSLDSQLVHLHDEGQEPRHLGGVEAIVGDDRVEDLVPVRVRHRDPAQPEHAPCAHRAYTPAPAP